MPTSQRFNQMKHRLAELQKHMLPDNFSPTGDYTDRQLDRTRGYRLLVHAEIESYLEDISRSAITNSIRKWKTNKIPTTTILAFISSYHSSWSAEDNSNHDEIIKIAKTRINPKESISEIIDLAQKQFTKIVQNNHGIKTKNFNSLIMPTGIDIGILDPTWRANLDNFGTLRGEIAHKTKIATNQINPKDELTTVRDLLRGLKTLDNLLYILLS